MTSTNHVELKCTTDTELPLKMVAKGSRRSTRRDKKSIVRVAASDIDHAEHKSSTEPEKLLGQHFSKRVEHVPIKKRRFMFPSPSPKKSYGRRRSSEHRTQINRSLPVSRLNQNLIDGGTSDGCCEKPDCSSHDFPEHVVQQQNDSTNVEGDDSSAGTAIVFQKYVAVDSRDEMGQGKNGIVASQKSSVESFYNDLADEQSIKHNKVAFEGMIAAKSTSILPVRMPKNSPAGEPTEKKNKSLKNVRLHWDLNVPMDAWDQPCDVEDDTSERDVDGEIIESMASKESEPLDGSKDHLDSLIASDGPKAEAAAKNGKECQSGYESQLEEGELREPYTWKENESDAGEVEQMDHEPKDEGFYSMVKSNDKKMEDSDKKILADALRTRDANDESDIEKHVVALKELPSHNAIKKIRYDDYEELGMDPYKSFGRDDRSVMRKRTKSYERGYFSGWGSRRRFSSPNYKGGSYGFEWPQPRCIIYDPGMMYGFDQSRLVSQPDGYVPNQFSNGGYRGRFQMFDNQFPGWMHNRMSGDRRERGNSPVFRRFHYPQSKSRSRSRSPVPRNVRNGSSHPRDGFGADERMMERVRFRADQEMGFMSPPRNRTSSSRLFERRGNDSGENHNSFGEKKFRPGKRLAEVTEDGNDDLRRFRFKEKKSVVVAKNNKDDNKECKGVLL